MYSKAINSKKKLELELYFTAIMELALLDLQSIKIHNQLFL